MDFAGMRRVGQAAPTVKSGWRCRKIAEEPQFRFLVLPGGEAQCGIRGLEAYACIALLDFSEPDISSLLIID